MNDKHAVEVYDFEKKQLIQERIPAEDLLRFMYHNETFSALSLRYALSKNSFISSKRFKGTFTVKTIFFCKKQVVFLK